MSSATDENEAILAQVESLGGGYVWESEIFAINLVDVDLEDKDVARLPRLVGVQQIALNAERLSLEAIEQIARIPQLESLVLRGCSLSPEQIGKLGSLGPQIELIS